MRDPMQDLVDRVSAESWERYLPSPANMRGSRHSAPARRALVVLAAASVAAAVVVVPTGLAHRVRAAHPVRPAASTAPVRPVASVAPKLTLPCKGAASVRAVNPNPLRGPLVPAAKVLTPADGVAGGYEQEQLILNDEVASPHLGGDIRMQPSVSNGQIAGAWSAMHTVGNGQQWQVAQQLARYSSGNAAAAYASAANSIACSPAVILAYQDGDNPYIIYTAESPLGPNSPGDSSILARTGDYLNFVNVGDITTLFGTEGPGPAIGRPYLEALAAVVQAKAAGKLAAPLPLPPGATKKGNSPPPPQGYLRPADLGPGWTARNGTYLGGDLGMPTETADLPSTDCRTSSGSVALTRTVAKFQVYRSSSPDPDATLTEQIMPMSAGNAAAMMAAVRRYAAAQCPQSGTVTSPPGVGDEILLVHRRDQPASAAVWVRSGGLVVLLDMLTGTGGSAAIPGGDAWLTATARAALARAQAK